jgi:plasmid stability protein
MSQDRPVQNADKYIVRLPDGMRDRIAEAAKANNRSMNAEIVARLEESFSPTGSSGAIGALALRLAETDLELRTNALESKVRLFDAHYASEVAIELIEFNKSLGQVLPHDDETVKHVRTIYRDAVEALNKQTPEDFSETIKELEAAKERRDALRLKIEKPVAKRVRLTLDESDAGPKQLRKRVKIDKSAK